MHKATMDIEEAVKFAAAHGPSELRHIDYLDGWRGLAIAMVLQAHFFEISGFTSGRLGVDVFFVLSGLLMGRILFFKRVPLGTFYKRRIARIVPVFVAYVAVMYGAAFVLHREERHNFLYTLTFTRAYFPTHATISFADIPISHLWSLNVEEHCYMFLGLVTLIGFLRGREGAVLMAVGTLCAGIHLIYVAFPAEAPANSAWRTEAAAGHLLLSSGYVLLCAPVARYVRPWMPVAALAAAIGCYTTLAPWWSRILASPYLLAFAVNHLAQAPVWFRRLLAVSGLRLLGVWSYSIYLWHGPFVGHHYFGNSGQAIACVVSVAIGIVSFYFFEKPIRTWLNKVW